MLLVRVAYKRRQVVYVDVEDARGTVDRDRDVLF